MGRRAQQVMQFMRSRGFCTQAPGDGIMWVRGLVPQLAAAMPAAPSQTTPELRAAYNAVCTAAWGDSHIVRPPYCCACITAVRIAYGIATSASQQVLDCASGAVQVTRNYQLPSVKDDNEVRVFYAIALHEASSLGTCVPVCCLDMPGAPCVSLDPLSTLNCAPVGHQGSPPRPAAGVPRGTHGGHQWPSQHGAQADGCADRTGRRPARGLAAGAAQQQPWQQEREREAHVHPGGIPPVRVSAGSVIASPEC